jgi:hypothetical protein
MYTEHQETALHNSFRMECGSRVTVSLLFQALPDHISTWIPDILNKLFEDSVFPRKRRPRLFLSANISPKLFFMSCIVRVTYRVVVASQSGSSFVILFLLEGIVLRDIYRRLFNVQKMENGRVR